MWKFDFGWIFIIGTLFIGTLFKTYNRLHPFFLKKSHCNNVYYTAEWFSWIKIKFFFEKITKISLISNYLSISMVIFIYNFDINQINPNRLYIFKRICETFEHSLGHKIIWKNIYLFILKLQNNRICKTIFQWIDNLKDQQGRNRNSSSWPNYISVRSK